MIKINRGPCPPVLENAGLDQDLYDKPEVIRALSQMQYGKCCYCEKHIGTTGQERAVEHFRPKAPNKFPHLKNTWSNLLHSCAGCNGKKWSHFPTDTNGNPVLIDPSDPDINPEQHLEFNVNDEDLNFGRVSPTNGSIHGKKTIETVGLDLPTRRAERVSRYNRLYSAYVDIVTAANEVTRQQKVRAFEMILQANNEYAAFARAFARAKKLDGRFGVRIPVGA